MVAPHGVRAFEAGHACAPGRIWVERRGSLELGVTTRAPHPPLAKSATSAQFHSCQCPELLRLAPPVSERSGRAHERGAPERRVKAAPKSPRETTSCVCARAALSETSPPLKTPSPSIPLGATSLHHRHTNQDTSPLSHPPLAVAVRMSSGYGEDGYYYRDTQGQPCHDTPPPHTSALLT